MTATDSIDTIFVEKDEESFRIDKLLCNRFSDKSRTYFQYLLENHLVLLNGKPVKKRVKPKEGDEIEVCFAATEEISLEPEDIPLDILYEDEHLLAINKPKGLVVHPAPGNTSHTFVNALLFHCKQLPQEPDSIRPGIVHRLDKDTTGVLLAAKTLEAHQKLITLFSTRQIEKEYLAICLGKPSEGLFSAPIGRHQYLRKKMTVCEEKGKEALSEFSLLAFEAPLSLIKIRLHTGRTHQIRVHLEHLRCPLLGDEVYGSEKANKSHEVMSPLLHAFQVRFTHPITNKRLVITAPPPASMESFMKKNFPSFTFAP